MCPLALFSHHLLQDPGDPHCRSRGRVLVGLACRGDQTSPRATLTPENTRREGGVG